MPDISPQTRFRTALSLADIQSIVSGLPSKELISRLGKFVEKAAKGYVAPLYTPQAPRESIEEATGFAEPEMSEEEKIRRLFELWNDRPNSLSKQQLAAVMLYRYETGLMTKRERYNYEMEEFGMSDTVIDDEDQE